MSTDRYLPRPGDIVVPVPHTLTLATRDRFDTAARAMLPSAVSLSPTAPDPRLVLDARACVVIDTSGVETLAALARAAAAAGVAAVVVDPAPHLSALLATHPARSLGPLAVAARAPAGEPPEAPSAGADREAVVLPLDDAARARLARRRRR